MPGVAYNVLVRNSNSIAKIFMIYLKNMRPTFIMGFRGVLYYINQKTSDMVE